MGSRLSLRNQFSATVPVLAESLFCLDRYVGQRYFRISRSKVVTRPTISKANFWQGTLSIGDILNSLEAVSKLNPGWFGTRKSFKTQWLSDAGSDKLI